MDAFCEQLSALLKAPEEYLRPNAELRDTWAQQSKIVYDFMKKEETQHHLPKNKEALSSLCVEGFDDEQIWQLIELQNKDLLAAPDNLDDLDDVNLCFMVTKLSSQVKYDQQKDDEEAFDGGGDEENSDVDASEDDLDGMEQDDDAEDMEGGDDDDSSLNEAIKESGLDTHFDSDSDNEVDNFDEFIAKEGYDSDDDDEDEDDPELGDKDLEREETEKKGNDKKAAKFDKSNLDSRFFNLRESEWIADNDIIGQNYNGDDEEDVDYMAEMSEDDDEEGVMYNDFFDKTTGSVGSSKKLSEMLPDDEEDDGDQENGMEDDDDDDDKSVDNQVQREEPSEDEDHSHGQNMEEKSTYEKEKDREKEVISKLEEDLIAAKPWHLKGEVSVKDRPENSVLEESMEYNISSRQKPVITEDITTLLERVIMGRIRSKAWDDVERKVKPVADPSEYKKKLLLEQEKSKQSLAEIYEKEYIKQQQEEKESGSQELEEHKEIRTIMENLFSKLDSLANFHYLPSRVKADLEIKNNMPAISLEDATPITMSDGATLAPQEVLEPVKGALKGKDERNKTDKKRERRIKKAHQRLKAKTTENKLKEKMKKAGPGGRLDRKSTAKVVEKAVKAGHVKMLDEKQTKSVRSSQSFFKQLQETGSGKNKQNVKKKKVQHGLSASRILL